MRKPAATAAGLTHAAAFYGTPGQYLESVLSFIEAGLANRDPVFVAVPGPKSALLRDRLNGASAAVTFADMRDMGRNPAWIIPRVQAFIDAHPDTPVRYVGEPIWPTRTAEELTEATRHEALINQAFARAPASILCPYDTEGLPARVLENAERTHPVLIRDGSAGPSPRYASPSLFPDGCDEPLPPPPAGAPVLRYGRDPSQARAFVREHAARAGLGDGKLADVVIAVGELAANTRRHTAGDGIVVAWTTPAEFICEVRDSGLISDALAGRRCPPPDALGGHGLWVVHQLCDLVELRTGSLGTAIRLHLRRAA
jgi:anti-sigma regulatory factor (Ser/Thr protein kinase)